MKKGFLFYVGFLLLVLFGAALVMLVVLFCSPGTEILGFKYFSYKEKLICETTSDDSATALELGTEGKYSEIKIDAGYAKVELSHSNDYEKNAIVIVNNAKGFTLAKDETPFEYSVKVEGSVLSVNVTEPTGFLHFSEDIKIIVHIADKEANPFTTTKFTVKTTSGDIEFGGAKKSAYDYDISVGQLHLETESGLVSITPRVNYDEESDSQTFANFTANIGGGKFTSNVETFKIYGNATLQAGGGKYSFNKLIVSGNTYVKTDGGTYDINALTTDLLSVECTNGYFYIDEIAGNVKFPGADMNIDSPKLQSKKIQGDLTIISGNNMAVEVESIFGNAAITTKGGSVSIGNGKDTGLEGTANIKTESGKIAVYIADGNNNIKELTTDSGEVQVYLLGQVQTTTVINSKTGNVKVKFMTGKAYTFTFTYQTKTDEYDMNKVKFVDYPNITIENPFVYTENADVRGNIEIHTDANVELSLFAA